MSPSRPRRAVARRAPLIAAAPAAGQGPQPRGRASSCAGPHQPWERGLMGNRKSAAWPSWSMEPSSQGPGEDKVKTTLLSVHCSLLEHRQPSRTGAPTCPALGDHPEPGQQLTAGRPHPRPSLWSWGETAPRWRGGAAGAIAWRGQRVGRAMQGPSGDPHSGAVQRPPPPSTPSLQAHPERREPRPPEDSQPALTQGPEHTPSLPEPYSAWAPAPEVFIESHLSLSPGMRISAHPSLHQ